MQGAGAAGSPVPKLRQRKPVPARLTVAKRLQRKELLLATNNHPCPQPHCLRHRRPNVRQEPHPLAVLGHLNRQAPGVKGGCGAQRVSKCGCIYSCGRWIGGRNSQMQVHCGSSSELLSCRQECTPQLSQHRGRQLRHPYTNTNITHANDFPQRLPEEVRACRAHQAKEVPSLLVAVKGSEYSRSCVRLAGLAGKAHCNSAAA